MFQSTIDPRQTAPVLQYAYVTRVAEDGKAITLQTDLGEVDAKRAVSCLLQPVTADQVLLSSNRQHSYVLAVLTRGAEGVAAMTFDGDVTFHARGGSITLQSEQELLCQAASAKVASRTGEFAIDDAALETEEATLHVSRLDTVIGRVGQVVETLTQWLGRYFRYTAGHEEKQAQSSRHLVAETLLVQSKNTVMQSQETTRLDGETVQMG